MEDGMLNNCLYMLFRPRFLFLTYDNIPCVCDHAQLALEDLKIIIIQCRSAGKFFQCIKYYRVIYLILTVFRIPYPGLPGVE